MPRFVGFYAANSTVPNCPSIEAVIDAFEITSAVPLPEQMPPLPVVGRQIFEEIVDVASGKRSKSELSGVGEEEFAPWIIGPVPGFMRRRY